MNGHNLSAEYRILVSDDHSLVTRFLDTKGVLCTMKKEHCRNVGGIITNSVEIHRQFTFS